MAKLERLIQDGRIHPGRIEDIVKKVEKEVEQIIRETGEKAASFDCGVHDVSIRKSSTCWAR